MKHFCPECTLLVSTRSVRCNQCSMWFHAGTNRCAKIEHSEWTKEWVCLNCQTKAPFYPCTLEPSEEPSPLSMNRTWVVPSSNVAPHTPKSNPIPIPRDSRDTPTRCLSCVSKAKRCVALELKVERLTDLVTQKDTEIASLNQVQSSLRDELAKAKCIPAIPITANPDLYAECEKCENELKSLRMAKQKLQEELTFSQSQCASFDSERQILSKTIHGLNTELESFKSIQTLQQTDMTKLQNELEASSNLIKCMDSQIALLTSQTAQTATGEAVRASSDVVNPTKTCFYFLSQGRCQLGNQCTYAHQIKGNSKTRSNEDGKLHVQNNRRVPVCRAYKKGFCKFGLKCEFRHVKLNLGNGVNMPIVPPKLEEVKKPRMSEPATVRQTVACKFHLSGNCNLDHASCKYVHLCKSVINGTSCSVNCGLDHRNICAESVRGRCLNKSCVFVHTFKRRPTVSSKYDDAILSAKCLSVRHLGTNRRPLLPVVDVRKPPPSLLPSISDPLPPPPTRRPLLRSILEPIPPPPLTAEMYPLLPPVRRTSQFFPHIVSPNPPYATRSLVSSAMTTTLV